ncbi:MAG TPA: hypothetical protein VHX60_11920 [Acidobacteriaceae bacterium]|jgi:hypothetical protein|nr:hypothetical protein [Acidobacteriaceae bacterium]
MQPASNPARFPPRLLITGALTAAAACASWWLMVRGPAPCDTLAPLTVLATLAAFLISVCFRQMGRHTSRASRWFLVACLVLAAATIFTDFRFVRRYRGFCEQMRQSVPATPQSH